MRTEIFSKFIVSGTRDPEWCKHDQFKSSVYMLFEERNKVVMQAETSTTCLALTRGFQQRLSRPALMKNDLTVIA